MRKKYKTAHVLYDSKKKIYFAETKRKEHPQVTKKMGNAKCFSEKETKKAWLIAYKLAWLKIGNFYLHEIEF